MYCNCSSFFFKGFSSSSLALLTIALFNLMLTLWKRRKYWHTVQWDSTVKTNENRSQTRQDSLYMYFSWFEDVHIQPVQKWPNGTLSVCIFPSNFFDLHMFTLKFALIKTYLLAKTKSTETRWQSVYMWGCLWSLLEEWCLGMDQEFNHHLSSPVELRWWPSVLFMTHPPTHYYYCVYVCVCM